VDPARAVVRNLRELSRKSAQESAQPPRHEP
jgi:hypothetical protein